MANQHNEIQMISRRCRQRKHINEAVRWKEGGITDNRKEYEQRKIEYLKSQGYSATIASEVRKVQ